MEWVNLNQNTTVHYVLNNEQKNDILYIVHIQYLLAKGGLMYINRCRAYIDFMLSQQQWSGLTKETIDLWLSNFEDLEKNDKELVYKLLTNLIYFSEQDVIKVLSEGLRSCISDKIILKAQIDSDFCLSAKALENIYRDQLEVSCFIPLLDSGAPHESGNYISRLLVQEGLIKTTQSMFAEKITQYFVNTGFKRLVIVDDCVGSGDQLDTFWNETYIQNVDNKMCLLRDFCVNNNIEAKYLTLFGYEKNIKVLNDRFDDLEVFCARMLGEELRVFSDNSYIWKDGNELKKALIPLYGHKNLDFAFIMHKTIPDWSLPLFWKTNSDWELLLRRKNSDG